MTIRRTFLYMLMMTALPVLISTIAHAQQSVPQEAINQFNHVIGGRVEATAILGGDFSAAGGIYSFHGGNVASLSITKAGGGGDVGKAEDLGIGDLKSKPVLQGAISYSTAENDFDTGFLQGNRSFYRIFSMAFGGGARVFVTDRLSFAPTISGIYGHINNTFEARNSLGNSVKAAASGTYVDWELDTWSAVPSIDMKYTYPWGRTKFELISRYNYFHTESFKSSSPVVSVSGNSQTWENRIDADVPLGWHLFNKELHTGGFYSYRVLSGSAATGLGTNNMNTLNGRLVLATPNNPWHFRWFGLGFSRFWSDSFRGWSAGADFRLEF